jgi:soluble lytic murein transglycosylase
VRASVRGTDPIATGHLGGRRTGGTLTWLMVGLTAAAVPANAATSKHPAQIATKQAKQPAAKTATKPSAREHASKRHHPAATVTASRIPVPPTDPRKTQLPGDLGVLQRTMGLVRERKFSDARTLSVSLEDPTARKLIEWTLLRNPDSETRFDRYQAFIRANPNWPGLSMLRRRAEVRLWQERRDGATVRDFVAGQPTSALGRLAQARMLMADGARVAAEREIRATWRADELSDETEAAVMAAYGDVLTHADHTARMNRRIGAKDFGGAMRAAKRVGGGAVAIVKACAAAERNSDAARKLLEAASSEADGDLGYTLCRVHYLLLHDGVATATRLVLDAAPETMADQDTDEWWRERRTLARKLLDLGNAKTAYQVVAGAALPANPYYRAEFHFMPGWIALRFLADPATALTHFAHIDDGATDPIVLARAAYWRGRAQEAAGHTDAMRASYVVAARHPTAYYGQLARARLGLGEMALRPALDTAQGADAEVVRAAELLYAVGERDLALSFVTGFAERSEDAVTLSALGDLAARNQDARATLLIGKSALARGLPLDVYAFPQIGVPRFSPIGPNLDRSIVFSVARTESEFNQRDVSPAKAVGIMQVTPEAGRDTAKRFKVSYDWNKLVTDPVYNTQMGAAELAALLQEYRGSHIMSFAGYNAGRGRVQQWVRQYGDPRDPKVDPIDWVERIPFAETRNYVQRIIENIQVYRARFGAGSRLMIEADLRRGGSAN